jgi:hypothetical protein
MALSTSQTAALRHDNSNGGEGKESEPGLGSIISTNVKVEKRKFEMSGPLAAMVQERMRKRNEL